MISVIRNDDDLKAALARIEAIFDAPVGSPEFEELDRLATIVEEYEDIHYPIGPPVYAPAESVWGRVVLIEVKPDRYPSASGKAETKTAGRWGLVPA